MAEIIDLDFYRKFRIVLPVRTQALDKAKDHKVSRVPIKRYRRRQKEDPKSKLTKKE